MSRLVPFVSLPPTAPRAVTALCALALGGCLFDNAESDDDGTGPAPAVGVLPDAGDGAPGQGEGGQASVPSGGGAALGGGESPANGGEVSGTGGEGGPGGKQPAGGESGEGGGNVGGDNPRPGGESGEGGRGPQPGGMSGEGGTPSPPPAGTLGAACERDADCGPDGVCILGLPGGYCSFDCANAECPDGGTCWELGEAGTRCLQTCAADRECRRAEGYICDADSTCYPGESGGPAGDGDVGGPCDADADCGEGGACIPEEGRDGPTGFQGGYCISLGCSQNTPCPAGAGCYEIGNNETACLASCSGNDDCRPGYACDPVGACLPSCTDDSCPEGQVCGDEGICREPPCTPQSCGAGTVCGADGYCQIDLGEVPAGPPPRCNDVPAWECDGNEAFCGDLVAFNPREGEGYFCNHEAYRSHIRRDVMLMVKHAAAAVECLTVGWRFGNGPPLGLGDMSEANGDIPGTSIGQPGHPEGTHVNGFDMDLAYYQINTANNQLRPVCTHVRGGEDQYHCIEDPTTLDVWRSALFIGLLHKNPQLRVIGVDGRIGPSVERAVDALCDEGYLAGTACRNLSLAFEVQDEGRGWYRFHHHHFHISFVDRPGVGLNSPLPGFVGPANESCITRGCVSRAPPKRALATFDLPPGPPRALSRPLGRLDQLR